MVTRIILAVALAATLLAGMFSGVLAEADPTHACLVGVIVSTSAGPGFGQETVDLAQSGTLDPAGVAAAYCH